MDQKPDAPQDPSAKTPEPVQSGAGHVDLGKILLPKKLVPGASVDSAERINAGALLEQEQRATLVPSAPPIPPAPPLKPSAPKAPAPQAAPKPEEPLIPPLQTYQGDIESIIQSTGASTVSIAAAEAARRAEAPLAKVAPPVNWKGLLKHGGMIAGGAMLFVIAGGVLYLAYDRLVATVPIPQAAPAPFIPVDGTIPLALPPGGLLRTTLMEALESARRNNTLSLGLIGMVTIFETTQTEDDITYAPLGLEDWLPVLAPNLPAELLRTLTGAHVLGVHTYDGTQAFFLFEVDSYERAFAAMLTWERTMRGDLLPLFNREPRPRLLEEGAAVSEVGTVPQLIQTGFSDKILENRDARVILNTSSDILLLWAPLGPNLFVITTNEYTLREIISRLGL